MKLAASVSLAALALAACATTAAAPVPATAQTAAEPSAAPAAGPATAEQARDFIARAEKELADLNVINQRAQWVNSTYITEDTDALAAYFGTLDTELRVRTRTVPLFAFTWLSTSCRWPRCTRSEDAVDISTGMRSTRPRAWCGKPCRRPSTSRSGTCRRPGAW